MKGINDGVTHGSLADSVRSVARPAGSAPASAPRQDPAAGGKVDPSNSRGSVPSPSDISESVSQVNDAIQAVQRDLRFSVDEESGRTVVRVLDSETQEIIRQIPAEEVLKLATALKDAGLGLGGQTTGILVESKA